MKKMLFYDWCKKDIEDDRKINYKFKTRNGELKEFTSDDLIPYDMLKRLANSWIDTVKLVDNKWNVVVHED